MNNSQHTAKVFSPSGATMELRLRIRSRFSLGPALTWQLFDSLSQRVPSQPDSKPSQRLYTWRERRFLITTIVAHYYFLKRETMLPFIGMGAGITRIHERFGAFDDTETPASWHLHACPEIGMYLLHGRIPIWLSSRLLLEAPTPAENGEVLLQFSLGVTIPN